MSLQSDLKLTKKTSEFHHLPNFQKRNARYRGPRESEKYLNGHQEQLYDIRKNWKIIDRLTELKDDTIHALFNGETELPIKKNMISGEKTFLISPNQTTFTLIPNVSISKLSSILVKLDGVEIDSKEFFVDRNILHFNPFNIKQNPKQLDVIFVGEVLILQDYHRGIHLMKRRLKKIDERLSELERGYTLYENAY